MLVRGTKVIVLRPTQTGTDAHGNPTVDYTSEVVDNVLVNAPSTEDVFDSQGRQNDDTIAYSLAFPKIYTKTLRDCRIIIPAVDPDREWVVIGNPMPIPHLCPTNWNRKALVKAYE